MMMNRVNMWAAAALFGIGALTASVVVAQNDSEPALPSMKPGPEHEQLAQRAGAYTTTTKFWPEAGQPPVEVFGAAKIAVILGGRFTHETSESTFGGQPQSGLRLIGFNNGTRKYEGTWSNTLSTGMLIVTGTSTDAGRTIRWTGTWDDGPQAGGKQTLFAIERVTDDGFTIDMYEQDPAADTNAPAVMSTTYRRK